MIHVDLNHVTAMARYAVPHDVADPEALRALIRPTLVDVDPNPPF
jgi:hypothetical protein